MRIWQWIGDRLAQAHWQWWTRPRRAQAGEFWQQAAAEQSLAPAAWRELQLRRLRAMLVFAGERVPYYRQLFASLRLDPARCELPGDLARIPMLTKDLVRAQGDQLLASDSDRSNWRSNSTGGSTGVPLAFFQDAHYRQVSEGLGHLVKSWWGIRPYDREAYIWGADRDWHERTWRHRWYEWRRRRRGLNAFRMDDAGLESFCRMLTRWRPPYLAGYATALETLARCALRHGWQPTFRAIRSSAEVLTPRQRQLIEQAFASPVYDFYGSREVNNLAAECPEGRRLHLVSSWRYLEIVDEAGRPLPAGQPGDVLVTDLSNFAMPFIRYRNEDRATLATELCQCGRPTPLLSALHGRRTDVIVLPNGGKIHGEWFTHLFYETKGIGQFQIHQTALEQIILRYVPCGETHAADVERVVAAIRQRLGPSIAVRVEACAAIPCGPSGKHRFTLSDVVVEPLPALAAKTQADSSSRPLP